MLPPLHSLWCRLFGLPKKGFLCFLVTGFFLGFLGRCSRTLRHIRIDEFLPAQLNQREFALLISTNQNNLSSILNRLEDMKYIKIEGNPLDKSENQIKLTEKGNQIFLLGKKKAEELQEGITRALNHSDVNVLSEYLMRINKNIPD